MLKNQGIFISYPPPPAFMVYSWHTLNVIIVTPRIFWVRIFFMMTQKKSCVLTSIQKWIIFFFFCHLHNVCPGNVFDFKTFEMVRLKRCLNCHSVFHLYFSCTTAKMFCFVFSSIVVVSVQARVLFAFPIIDVSKVGQLPVLFVECWQKNI